MGPIWIPVLIKSMSNNKNRSVNIVKRILSLAHHIKCIIKKTFLEYLLGMNRVLTSLELLLSSQFLRSKMYLLFCKLTTKIFSQCLSIIKDRIFDQLVKIYRTCQQFNDILRPTFISEPSSSCPSVVATGVLLVLKY